MGGPGPWSREGRRQRWDAACSLRLGHRQAQGGASTTACTQAREITKRGLNARLSPQKRSTPYTGRVPSIADDGATHLAFATGPCMVLTTPPEGPVTRPPLARLSS